jgi:plasmid stability protein
VVDVLIRELDEHTHAELKRRAEAAGVSMQQYIARLLSAHVQRPTQQAWLERLDTLRPVESAEGAQAVAAARDELP